MPNDFAKAAAERAVTQKIHAQLLSGLTKAATELKKSQGEAQKTKKDLSGEADD